MSQRTIAKTTRFCDSGSCAREAAVDESGVVATCRWCSGDCCEAHAERMTICFSAVFADDDGEDEDKREETLICLRCANRFRKALGEAIKEARAP